MAKMDNQVKDRTLYLPVYEKTGQVDYGYIQYDITESPDEDKRLEGLRLSKGWEWRLFKITPA